MLVPIARGFVASMGATLEIDDTPGCGVTFCIGLAVAEPHTAPC